MPANPFVQGFVLFIQKNFLGGSYETYYLIHGIHYLFPFLAKSLGDVPADLIKKIIDGLPEKASFINGYSTRNPKKRARG